MDRGIAILLVSNHVGDVAQVRKTLVDSGAFGVYIAGSAQKALATLARRDLGFAAILIDAELPDSPGLILLRQVMARGFAGPVIFVAKDLEKGLAAEALAAGAYEVLPKFENFWAAIPKLVLRGLERARLVQRIRDLDAEVARLEEALAEREEPGAGEAGSAAGWKITRLRRVT